MYQNFIIPYLYEAQHVSGNTPPIIRSLTLQWQPLVFYMWKVAGRVADGWCQAQYSGFLYVEGCWTCSWWTLSGTVCA
jgi:hypothetical protein